MPEYLEKYGRVVLDNGYSICFIRPGEKRPFGKDWESTVHGTGKIAAAISAGRGGFGVGIKTRKTPGVDIDCHDPEIVAHMRAFVVELLGETLERVGLPPKTLLLYRADKPFRKVQSSMYHDEQGRNVKLEVLGDGQQFVAFHIHPDTKKPYRWKDKRAPHNVAAADLPVITVEQAGEIAAEFDRLAQERGWQKASTAKRMQVAKTGVEYDYDDPFISDKAKVEIATDDLRAKLDAVPGREDYDTWFQVGMALYHQFDGSEEGLILWHEWSSQASNYNSDALDEKWSTFNVEGKKREPLTAQFILKLAVAEEERLATEELQDIRASLEMAPDLPAIREIAARVKKLAFDSLTREWLVNDIRKRIKTVSGTMMSITSVRQLVRYENPDNRSIPPWLDGYVFIQQDETFYSLKSRQSMSRIAFDASFARHMMTKKDRLEGNTVPEHSASHVALNRYQIPCVSALMYLPNEEAIFNVNGLDYANSFNDANIPSPPDRFTKAGRRAIQIIERHLEHLFMIEEERKLLLDWLCYIVQTGKRVNWAPVVQGVQGDGKTFFHLLMGWVLGAENVNTIPGEALAEKNTAWAQGSQFCLIEEVRLHGQDRFAVINKVKPYITNVVAPIRRMSTDWYSVINTVSYFLVTNHKDGVPVDANDTRFFAMFSRWQNKPALEAFEAANPTYYDELYSIGEHAAELRKWMLERPLSAKFNPLKRAPLSQAKAEMIYLNSSDEEDSFTASVEISTDRDYCKTLINASLVAEKMNDEGGIAPYGRGLKKMLSDAGFTYLGRPMIDGERIHWWSQTPDRFRTRDGAVNKEAIKDWLDEI